MIRYGNCQSTDERVTLKLLQESQNYSTRNETNNESAWGQWLMDDINQTRVLPKVQHRRVLTYSIQNRQKDKERGNEQNKKYQNTKIANLRKLLAIHFNKNAVESCRPKLDSKPSSRKFRKMVKITNFESAKQQLEDMNTLAKKNNQAELKIKTGRQAQSNRKIWQDEDNKWSVGLLKMRRKSIFY